MREYGPASGTMYMQRRKIKFNDACMNVYAYTYTHRAAKKIYRAWKNGGHVYN